MRNKAIFRVTCLILNVGAGLAPALVDIERATARVAPTIFFVLKIFYENRKQSHFQRPGKNFIILIDSGLKFAEF